MAVTGVLVADKSRARLFVSNSRTGPLMLQESWQHPPARMHEQELTTDLPGKAFDSSGMGRHAMGTAVAPKAHEAEVFAARLAREMDQRRCALAMERLHVLASPEFLGLLRRKFSRELARLIVSEKACGLAAMSGEEVREHLPDFL